METLLLHLRLAGLPDPEREVRFAPPRRWRWDACWRPQLVAVEYQGMTWARGRHTRGRGYEQDAEKLVEGQLRGWLVVYATAGMVRSGLALSLVERALALRAGR